MTFGKTNEQRNADYEANRRLLIVRALEPTRHFAFVPLKMQDGRWAFFRYVWMIFDTNKEATYYHSINYYDTKELANRCAMYSKRYYVDYWRHIHPEYFKKNP